MTIKEAMKGYFRRLMEGRPPPKTCRIDDVDPMLFIGKADEEGWIEWGPIEKTTKTVFAPLEERAGAALHSSIKEYYDAFWFMDMGGRFHEHTIQLDPVIPGVEVAELANMLLGGPFGSGYIAAHDGILHHVPIGIHHPSDLLLVVNNMSGEVAIEDFERGEFQIIANDLAQLISHLQC